MVKSDRMLGFFIVLAGIYYAWSSYILPLRLDEAFFYLKSIGSSWQSIAPTGIMEYLIQGINFFGDSSLNLRLLAIIFISFTLLIIYNITYSISDRTGAWFSMMMCFVSIPVSYAYISITPNGLFIFAGALFIYGLFKIITEEKNEIRYYIWVSFALLLLVTTDITGIIFVILPFLYGVLKKELFKNKAYVIMALSGIFWVVLFAVLHYFGLFSIFYKYPVYENDNMIFYYVMLLITYLPLIYILFVYLNTRAVNNKIHFLFVSAVFLGISYLIVSIIFHNDIRNAGAFLPASIILTGYYFESYKYKVLLGIFIIFTVFVSVYTTLAPKSPLTPKNMEYSKIYEFNRFGMQEIIGLGEMLFSYDEGFSSLLSYNILIRPEACTLNDCSGSSGVFVSIKKEDNLTDYFENVKETRISRLISKEDGVLQLYCYSVSGLKTKKK